MSAAIGCAVNEIRVETARSGGFFVHRKTLHGEFVNIGRNFSEDQVDTIREFVAVATEYLTWERHWKPFLRTIK